MAGCIIPRPHPHETGGPANHLAAVRVSPGMDTNLIKTKFAKLGARARIRPVVQNRWRLSSGRVVIDVQRDRHGEYFDIQADDAADVEVLDVQSKDRHLLLMVRQPNQRPGSPDTKAKFLCGHDERHWFVAGVPEKAAVSSVVTAKEGSSRTSCETENRYSGANARSGYAVRRTCSFARASGSSSRPRTCT